MCKEKKECENSATGKHEPSVIVSAEIDRADRDRVSVYMSCRYCGRACSFVVLHEDLWQSDPPKVFVPKSNSPKNSWIARS